RHLHACSGLLPAGAVAGWDLHPLESAAFSRREPKADLAWSDANVRIGWSGPQLSGCSSFAPPDFIGRRCRVRKADRDCNIEPPASPYAIMRRACPTAERTVDPARMIVGELDTQTRN